MTEKDQAIDIDYWFHGNQKPHEWTYRGKLHGYRCTVCGLRVSKQALKENTDA